MARKDHQIYKVLWDIQSLRWRMAYILYILTLENLPSVYCIYGNNKETHQQHFLTGVNTW